MSSYNLVCKTICAQSWHTESKLSMWDKLESITQNSKIFHTSAKFWIFGLYRFEFFKNSFKTGLVEPRGHCPPASFQKKLQVWPEYFNENTVYISVTLGYGKGFNVLYIYCFESPYFLSRLLHRVSFPVVSSEFTI